MKSNTAGKFAKKFFQDIALNEINIANVPGAVGPNDNSPVRFEIIQEKL